MLKFDEYLADFNATVQLNDFLINLLVASLLALTLRWFYIRYGLSVSNRVKFAINFVPLALTTMLVITVVQTSIALSLGLVGALSIVRFRAAIKEPEELVFLFLSISIGLVTGANKPILAAIGVFAILFLLFINYFMKSKAFVHKDNLFLNITTKETTLAQLTGILSSNFSHVELKRFDTRAGQTYASFLIQSNKVNDIDSFSSALKANDEGAVISIIDQPNLVV